MERFNTPLTKEAAKSLLALDLEDKVITSYEKLDEWYTAWGGQCYVSFSGGKDSTVLSYLAARYLSSFRTPPWPLNLVFVNTGLEYPEIQKFVNEYADWLRKEFPRVTVNLHRLRPKMNIRQVVTKYGYSVIGKDVAHRIETARRSPESRSMKLLRGEVLRIDGEKSMYNCEKWEYLLSAPFLISDKCCGIMKKSPAKSYEHREDVKPTTATMAEEGLLRMQKWRETGCNAFEGRRPLSKPMSFWTEQDVLRFIVERQIPYASVYGDIVAREPMPLVGAAEYTRRHDPNWLVQAWFNLMGRSTRKKKPTQEKFEPLVTAPFVSVASRVSHMLRGLLKGSLQKMGQLFSHEESRSTNVATFLALLELIRAGRVKVDDSGTLQLDRTHRRRKDKTP